MSVVKALVEIAFGNSQGKDRCSMSLYERELSFMSCLTERKALTHPIKRNKKSGGMGRASLVQ